MTITAEEQFNINQIKNEYKTVEAHLNDDDFKEQCSNFFENTKGNYRALNLSLLRWECERDCNHIWGKEEDKHNVFKEISRLVHRTEDFYTNPCDYRTNDDPNRHLCEKECDQCISKKHWLGIINNHPNHFVDENNSVYFMTDIDYSGSIGKRYRRADVIGTPFCITVDDETINNNTVTVRFRDTMEQVTINVDDIVKFVEDKIRFSINVTSC